MKMGHLPDSILVKGRTLYPVVGYKGNLSEVEQRAKKDGRLFRNVSVMNRGLVGKIDLHRKPYRPSNWLFVERITRQQLTNRLMEMIKEVGLHKGYQDDLNQLNCTTYLDCLIRDISLPNHYYSQFADELDQLKFDTQHLHCYSAELNERINREYKLTEAYNREVIYPILAKHMEPDAIPFTYVSKFRPHANNWVTHVELLFFNTKEAAEACWLELSPYVTFDTTDDDPERIRFSVPSRGYSFSYHLNYWNELYNTLVGKMIAEIPANE